MTRNWGSFVGFSRFLFNFEVRLKGLELYSLTVWSIFVNGVKVVNFQGVLQLLEPHHKLGDINTEKS